VNSVQFVSYILVG